MDETAGAPDVPPFSPNHTDGAMHLWGVLSMKLSIPSFHIHVALCIGDDEDVDIAAMFRGWRGRFLRFLGFTVEDRWVLIHRVNETHIVPVNDGMDHDMRGDECVCGPFGACSTHGNEADTWLYTHASLDVREVPPTVADLTS